MTLLIVCLGVVISESISAVILAALSLLYLEILTNDESVEVLVKFEIGI